MTNTAKPASLSTDGAAGHTPGPWSVSYESVYPVGGGGIIARCYSKHRSLAEQAANAARIVACVNACEGITDPATFIKEAEAAMLKEQANNALAAQRDALAEQLEKTTAILTDLPAGRNYGDVVQANRRALAAARAGGV